MGNNLYALKSTEHGERYLKVNGKGCCKTTNFQTFMSAWERFYIEKKETGKVAFKSTQ